jgi:two-component system, NarL family, response regulator DegU
MNKTTIIIADDHPLFRSGVRNELDQASHLQVIAETGNGEKALELIRELNPDIAILDFQMPGLTGLEITTRLSQVNCKTQVILLTMHNDKKILYKALDVGIKGYVLKDDAVSDITNAVDKVIHGGHFISEKLTGMLMDRLKSTASKNSTGHLIENLTPTERRILALVASLKSNDEIASELFVSKRTVENHKVNISGKLHLGGARELLKFALENNEFLT